MWLGGMLRSEAVAHRSPGGPQVARKTTCWGGTEQVKNGTGGPAYPDTSPLPSKTTKRSN